MATAGISLADVYRARAVIAPLARRTPLVPSPSLSAHAKADVHLKLETLQDTGAFKVRGAANRILSLSEAEARRGVVTVSTGNHGRAVAFAAAHRGIRAVVCLSQLVPATKVEAIRTLEAEPRIIGTSQDEAQVEAERLEAEEGLTFVNPFDDPWVIAGQGTIGLELLEDMPDIDTAIVPLGGGGLIGGIALVLKAASSNIRVVGVSMERGPAMIESQAAGKPIFVEEVETIADALGGGIGLDNRYTFALVRDFVDDMIRVSEEQIAAAMVHAYRHERLIVEGGAAVGMAALLNDLVPALGQRVAMVVSSKSVDMDQFGRIIAAAA